VIAGELWTGKDERKTVAIAAIVHACSSPG
jgi:hypothetical protein